MQQYLFLFIMTLCLVPAIIADCPAGQQYRSSSSPSKRCLAGPSSCVTCCINSPGTCGHGRIVCPLGLYKDKTKNADLSGNATEAKINCCSERATCADVACPAGQEYKSSSPSSTKCPQDPSSCTSCCKWSAGTCGAETVLCPIDFYKDSKKDADHAGNAAETNCCSKRATCADVKCPAGQEYKSSTPLAQTCLADPSSCTGCCKWSAGTCGADTYLSCPSGYYKDSKKYANPSGSEPKTNCCSEKATCADVKHGDTLKTAALSNGDGLCPRWSVLFFAGTAAIVGQLL